jgi:hypothetical protein
LKSLLNRDIKGSMKIAKPWDLASIAPAIGEARHQTVAPTPAPLAC